MKGKADKSKLQIIKLKGGLGNQMFQYAFAKCMQQYTENIVKLDLSYYMENGDQIRKPRILKYNLSLPVAMDAEIKSICIFSHFSKQYRKIKMIFERLLNRQYYIEPDRRYRSLEILKNYSYFDGYWQSWRYADNVIEDLKKEFTPNYVLDDETNAMITQVKNENSVFVGIRRGDYALEQSHYGEFKQDYYDKAMQYIESKVENPIYYIFSNDIEWVKENISFGNRQIIYRENEDVIDDFEELMIMMNCKHSIIINSTYHWWAARLMYQEGKIVVAPKKWFADNKPIDIVPPEWIRI